MSWRKRVGHGSLDAQKARVRGGQRKWIASPEGRERRTQFHVCQHSRMTMVNRDVLPTLS